MAKDVKIVKSKTAPVDKNVLWDDGENLKIYRNGVWENTNSTEIKEGSIPMSALRDDTKELINNSLGFKAFYGYLSVDAPLEIPAYGGGDYYYVKVNDDIIQLNTVNGDETHIPVGPPFSIKYDVTEYPKAELSIVTDYPDAHRNLKFPIFRGINTNKVFIPNTVIKTTPQELSDTDKNQALANLGIDPVVWKYVCEPFAIPIHGDGGLIPEDLYNIIMNEEKIVRPIALKLMVADYDAHFEVFKEANTNNKLITISGETIAIDRNRRWSRV